MSSGNSPADGPSQTSAPKPAEDAIELRIFQALRRIIRAIDLHSRRLAGQHNITTPQLVTLLSIVEEGHLTPSDIAKRVHLSNSTVIGILDRLESKGLIVRERSREDRRVVWASATAAGRELATSAPSPLQDIFADALRKLDTSDQSAIADSLERVVDLMEAKDIDAAPVLETGPMAPSTPDRP